ncbi:MAG: dTMP kinase [Chitinispirillales bacterium]|jgi:dTMP kinase|nr:dTMP kinase [Chitinispirillales bacterium]
MKRGYFFTFEGIDGSGKSTQLKRVADSLQAKGLRCLVTREPGGTPVSERIREILLSPDNKDKIYPNTECLLYMASRAQHVCEVIAPAFHRGEIVLCDRFEQATFAYQGYGRGLDIGLLRNINQFATGGLIPDITFIFDVSVELSQERLSSSGKGRDRLESESTQFFTKVRQGYLSAAEANPQKIVLLDGSRNIEELTEQVLNVLYEYIGM